MKRYALLTASVVLMATSVLAQERGTTVKIQTPAASPQKQAAQGGSLAGVTPEMWIYLQEMQRHDDPEMAVRRKAEERASQRQDRLAARRWFGLSNSRPTASPLPVMGTYSPFWAGQNSDPNRWDGVGGPIIQVYEAEEIIR